jgi:N-acetylmuramoyl-L-alanine amidase
MKNPVDSGLMESQDGRQKYADAVVKGIVAFLQTQPPRAS